MKAATLSLFIALCTISSYAQNVGIGQAAPASKLDVNGGVTIGTTYSGTNTAPANGAIIQGQVGIGNNSPNGSAILDLNNASNLGLLLPNVSGDPTIPSTGASSIPTPGGGLLIYNTTTKCVDVYVNGHWEPVYCSCPTLQTLTGLTGPTSVCYTSNNSYTVTALQGASTYTWSVTGSPTITGQGTNAISFTPSASLTNYTVSVTAYNACSVSSTASTSSMTVNEFTGAPGTPAWSGTAPASSVCAGATSVGYTITSAIGVNGTAALTYNWTFTATGTGTTATIVSTGQTIAVGSPVTISGVTNLSYALNYGSVSGGSITVSVTATNLCGTSSTPLSQTVSIAAQPSLTAITPATQIVCASSGTSPAAISTTASGGTGTITYQWFTSASLGTNTGGSSITSANSTSYTRPATVSVGTTYLYMTMTATGAGCVTATTPVNNASIQVTAQPSLTAPANGGQTVCTSGQIPTALTSTPSGGTGSGTTYQWYSCTSPSATTGSVSLSTGTGYNTTAYTPAAAGSAGTSYYYMTFSTTGLGCVTATSPVNNALVTTVAQPAISNPTAINECVNGTTALTVAGSGGTGTTTYAWYSNGTTNSNTGGTTATGSTNSTSYTPSSATAGTTYYYATYTTSGAGCGTSAPTAATAVVVNPTPTLTTTPLTATAVCYYTGGAQTTAAAYASTTNSPNQYSINWTGFANQAATSFAFASGGGSLNTINVPASTASGTYTGNLIVTISSTGCSTTYTNGISVTVNTALSTSINGYTTVGSKQQNVIYTTTSGQSGYVWSSAGGTLASALANGANTTTASWPTGNSYGGNSGAYNTTISVAYNQSGCTYKGSLPITVGGNYTSTTANSTAVVWPSSTSGWGVTTYFVQLWGGGGGGGDYGGGGGGGYVEGTITAPVGQTFNTWVGGGGGAASSAAAGGIGYTSGGPSGVESSNPAGAGGGSTAIGVTASVLAVAGGGGGGGGEENSTTNRYGQGGGGGNATSSGGGLDNYGGAAGNSGSNSAGGRTSSSGAGAAGGFSGCGCSYGVAASGGTGGAGNTASNTYAGGGGGGGYYGGGGGAGSSSSGNSVGGGGGGSSYFTAYNSGGITFTNGTNTAFGVTTPYTTAPSTNANPGYTGTNYNSTAGSGQGGNFSGVGVAGNNGEIYIGY